MNRQDKLKLIKELADHIKGLIKLKNFIESDFLNNKEEDLRS